MFWGLLAKKTGKKERDHPRQFRSHYLILLSPTTNPHVPFLNTLPQPTLCAFSPPQAPLPTPLFYAYAKTDQYEPLPTTVPNGTSTTDCSCNGRPHQLAHNITHMQYDLASEITLHSMQVARPRE